MLQYLKIANLALIAGTELEFGPGFNVVTGESGAGKSILFGALALLLGGRGDKNAIRTGERRCEVAGEFAVPAAARPAVAALLENAGIATDPAGTVRLRRVITAAANRFFINDSPVSAAPVRALAELLVDLHSVHAASALTDRAGQLQMLDRFAGAEALRERCARCWQACGALQAERTAFLAGKPSEVEAEQLERVVAEIERVNPVPGEDEAVAARHRTAAHAREIVETGARVAAALTESEDSARDRLAGIYRELTALGDAVPEELIAQCDALLSNLDDFSAAVTDFTDSVELDGETFARLEERLGELHTLKRRYGPTLEQVFATADAARDRLAARRAGEQKLAAFDVRERELRKSFVLAAAELGTVRRAAADQLTAAVTGLLGKLGFSHPALEIGFETAEPGPTGTDRVEFQFSANRGEALRPLRKIASSGELSRLMLAVKTVLADADSIPVAVFDEIDMNIGGETANVVGDLLRKLGERRQILCISHLSPVAARAHAHYRVEKHETGGRVVSEARKLDEAGRLDELTRMLGGGAAARAHAAGL